MMDKVTLSDSERARQALRKLPSISSLLTTPRVQKAGEGIRSDIVTAIAQQVVEDVRSALRSGEAPVNPEEITERVCLQLNRLSAARLIPVINGTGVIIHTNLGRAPVSVQTAQAMRDAASHYSPLELELQTGRRGGRMSEISRLLSVLTEAEETLVVNNNAAAILLTLSALCAGREVILSRSQAVEIGGGFRVPDVMAQSGAGLVEVGTTNRTYARDYEAAINENTAALLTVHPSNFRIVGFTSQPQLSELAQVARRHDLVLIEDLGSGALLDTRPYGLAHEPTVAESLASGVDVVCFSGDKLLGGPQAGIICGGSELVKRIAAHPLARAVRADKTALAGIAATLRHYLHDDVSEAVPVWHMISTSLEDLENRCQRWISDLNAHGIDGLEVIASRATVGGGSLPGETLESRALAISTGAASGMGVTLDQLSARLRQGHPPLMPRVDEGMLVIDARTVLPGQDGGVVEALAVALRSS